MITDYFTHSQHLQPTRVAWLWFGIPQKLKVWAVTAVRWPSKAKSNGNVRDSEVPGGHEHGPSG